MPFRTYCDNKGCGKDQEPLLNLETNDVECTECGNVIKSITPFTKTQMKSLGQIKRDEKRAQAFAVQCKHCNKTSPPKIDGSGKPICTLCNKQLDLSPHYVNAIKHYLSSNKE